MTQETATYITNIGTMLILAGLFTYSWAAQGRTRSMGFWMVAAWIMLLTSCLFAARPLLPFWFGRIVPTWIVSFAHAAILLGASATVGQPRRVRLVTAVILVHGIILTAFFVSGHPGSPWRTATNGVMWAGLSFWAFVVFRKGSVYFWQAAFSPANVMLAHGLFHVVRVATAALVAEFQWTSVVPAIQAAGDLEVSMFVVALYVSLLISTLRQEHADLMSTREEMRTLTGLLPICAWCKSVRNDEGYWQRVEEFFGDRAQVDFTHSICATCQEKMLAEELGKLADRGATGQGPRAS